MILEVAHITKTYDQTAAVDDVSFNIQAGTCFGLLGPNGAGKTTTIEIIEGIRSPDSGKILYKGASRERSFREDIGIQFQSTSLLSLLSVRETLRTFQCMYKKTARFEEVMRQCNLDEIANQPNDKISGGQRQRLLLALALINNPMLVFLDEPSTGLDPQARRNLWDLVQKIKNDGKTIILTTHYMEEAQLLCDVVAIMDHGRIIAQDSPQNLISQYCQGVTVALPKPQAQLPDNLDNIKVLEASDHYEIEARDIDLCLKTLMATGVDLRNMTVRSPNMEDVFLRLTGRQLRK